MKVNHIYLILILLIISIIGIYFYRMGIGFGNAAVNTIKGIKEANEQYNGDGINLKDTLTKVIIEEIEENSSNSNN